MTHPTKAICPILLEDFRKISVEKRGESHFFTSHMIKECMKKVITVNLHQTVKVFFSLCYVHAFSIISQVDNDLELKAYYAGHVLGAAMFYVKVGHQSVVYTVSL